VYKYNIKTNQIGQCYGVIESKWHQFKSWNFNEKN